MIYSENILLCISIPLLLTAIYTKGAARRSISAFLVGMVTCLSPLAFFFSTIFFWAKYEKNIKNNPKNIIVQLINNLFFIISPH